MIEVAEPAASPNVGVIHSIVLPEEKTSEVRGSRQREIMIPLRALTLIVRRIIGIAIIPFVGSRPMTGLHRP